MSQQSAVKNGGSTKWLDYLSFWICTSATLEEKLEDKVLDIFSVVSIVQGTYRGSLVSIAWDGTSNCVYHGWHQSTIAGKQMTIDILEIQLKKENISGLDLDQIILWGHVSNSIFVNRMTGKSQSVLTLSEVQANPLSVTLTSAGDNTSLFLELPRLQLE